MRRRCFVTGLRRDRRGCVKIRGGVAAATFGIGTGQGGQLKRKIGLIVNPIAGMGGSVGLKGTDGEMRQRALALGASPVAPGRVREFVDRLTCGKRISLLLAPGVMGADYLGAADVTTQVVGELSGETSPADTRRIAREMLEQSVELLVFVGGDGTARDICDAIGTQVAVVGVPSGVKVYSAAFANSVHGAASLVDAFVDGADLTEEEVLDIDEDAFRRGVLDARLYGYLLVPRIEEYLQGGKEASGAGGSSLENKQEIGEYVADEMAPGILYLLGPGTTVKAITDALHLDKTLLGVDAVYGGRGVGADLNEKGILELLDRYPRRRIVVTPLGGNGFIFGRGNRQFTSRVIRLVGRENIMVVANRDKLAKLACLRVDTDDTELNRGLSGYIDVITGYRFSKLVKVEY